MSEPRWTPAQRAAIDDRGGALLVSAAAGSGKVPLRKGDETATLLEAINSAIEELRADGTLSELGEKYFGQDISSEN